MVSIPQARIGFVSTRLAGTDGVSLEVAKWTEVLQELGHECFYFAGECDWPAERSYVVPEAHFAHPHIRWLTHELFDDYRRAPDTSRLVGELKEYLKEHIYDFVRTFDLNLLIVENALSLPMNIPFGLALTEFIAETEFITIAHHHDFSWERSRFTISAAQDYLRAAFPPTLHSIRHVVISSFAGEQLAIRAGIRSTVIPNVMDFEHGPPPPDDYAQALRADLGLEDGFFLLQPTRMVPRKRIELSIELARRLGNCTLVVTHSAGDEGFMYQQYLKEYANLLNVPVRFLSDRFNHYRRVLPDGRKVYALADAYQQADLVTYPSREEGFGNAFLEAVYYRRPIAVSAYQIFKTDIQPKGFQVIVFEEVITEEIVERVRQLLHDPDRIAQMVERNYQVARRHYSYSVLCRRLSLLLESCLSGEGEW